MRTIQSIVEEATKQEWFLAIVNDYSDGEITNSVKCADWLRKELEARENEVVEIRKCLSEAIDLMEDVITGDYKPDSFTTQPWKNALHPHEEKGCKHANCGGASCGSAACRSFKCHTKDLIELL